jgi:peptidoglycan biosynthesis protein MviN/MurJ (putative lipid II flippase)
MEPPGDALETPLIARFRMVAFSKLPRAGGFSISASTPPMLNLIVLNLAVVVVSVEDVVDVAVVVVVVGIHELHITGHNS